MRDATTIVIAVTVEGDHGENQHLGDRVANLFARHWESTMPRRLAQDIRVLRYSTRALGDLLNKVALGER